MKIVGIDPGTNRIGYALVQGTRDRVELKRAETIDIPSGTRGPDRLRALAEKLDEWFTRDHPDVVAVEKLFFATNVKTAISVAEARGVILLTASRHARSIGEYTPLEVKQALTGYGKATKPDVLRMVRLALPGSELPKGDDAIDAIAIALTAMYRTRADGF